jgi:hypothetical protein
MDSNYTKVEVEKYRSALEGLGYRMLGVSADAQDLAQETFVGSASRHPQAEGMAVENGLATGARPHEIGPFSAGDLHRPLASRTMACRGTFARRPRPAGLIFGASRGVGHMAVQIARQMGARVFAVASGSDGVALADELGADAAVDGQMDDVLAAARKSAPEGVDAALLTAGGETAKRAFSAVREGGRISLPQRYPTRAPDGIRYPRPKLLCGSRSGNHRKTQPSDQPRSPQGAHRPHISPCRSTSCSPCPQ